MFSSMSMGQKAGSGFTSAIMGAVLSWAAFDGLKEVQPASAIRAISVFYLYVPIAIWAVMFLLAREGGEAEAPAEEIPNIAAISENKINIAIGRLYGASGRKIAEGLAEALKCRVYDRQIICLLAEKLGMESQDMDKVVKYLDSYNENEAFAFSPYAYPAAGVAEDVTDMRMFEEQTKIIQTLAKQAPGVFLGRCANFVLGGQPHSYSFFVYADDEYREKEGKEYYKGQTLNELKLRDIQRNEYYERFTGMKRDDPKHYDMVVNVSKTGVDGAVKMILDYVEQKESGSK